MCRFFRVSASIRSLLSPMATFTRIKWSDKYPDHPNPDIGNLITAIRRESASMGGLPPEEVTRSDGSGRSDWEQVYHELLTAFPEGIANALGAAARRSLIDVNVLRALFWANGNAPIDELHPIIHTVVRHTDSAEALLVWIEAFPGGPKMMSFRLLGNGQELPLHIAAQQSRHLDVVRVLIKAFPQGARCKDDCGNLPVHRCAMTSNSVSIMRALIAANPEALTLKNNDDLLPLHICASLEHCNEYVFDLLFNFYPAAAGMLFTVGRAQSFTSSTHEGEITLAFLPEQLSTTTILHNSLESPLRLDRFHKILALCPQCARVQRSDGQLPLHMAITQETVASLLALYPRGARLADGDGNLPLHCAMKNDVSNEVVSMILKAYPGAACVQNNARRVPLEYSSSLSTRNVSLTDKVLHVLCCANNRDLGMATSALLSSDIRKLCKRYHTAFAPTRTDISNFHIHLCGEPFAGKSVVFHWLIACLRQDLGMLDRVGDILNSHYEITPDDRRATRGTVSAYVPYTTKTARSLHCIIRDYGGQAQFRLTHSHHLSCPRSIYIVVLPLYDISSHPAVKKWNSVAVLTCQLLEWLRMVYSAITRERSAMIEDEAVSEDDSPSSESVVPILIVVNTFSAFPNPVHVH